MSKWESKTVEETCEILDHMRIPVNEVERNKRFGDVPYYGANGLQGYIDKPLFNEKLVLLAEDGGNFEQYDTRPIAYRISGPAWVNNHAHILRNKKGYDLDFIFYTLQHRNILKNISGGTRGKLTQAELRAIEFECPKTQEEQKAIATVLDTVDEAIQSTQAILDKQDKIKQGLLHDLLTRGVDERGHLRPTPETAPDLYQQTEMGLIPKGWTAEKLDQVAVKIQDGTHFSPKTGGNEYLYITSKNIRFGFLDITNAETVDTAQHKEIYRRADVKPGDLLLTKDGANTGNAAINNIEDEISLLSSVAFLRFNERRDSSQFFLQYVLSPKGQRRLKDLMSGNAITRLTLEKIRNFYVPRPDVEEQKKIAGFLYDCDQSMREHEMDLQKLQRLKSGLMQDLLTGRKRVTSGLMRNVEKLAEAA